MIKALSIVNLIIVVQASFLVFHFFSKRKGEKRLNQLLGSLCLCFAIISIRTYNYLNPVLPQNHLLVSISQHIIWFIGPLLYLYVIYYEKKPNNRLMRLHLLPYVVIALVEVFFNSATFTKVIQYTAIIQVSVYLIISIAFCFRHYKQVKQFYGWIVPSLVTITLLLGFYIVARLFKDYGLVIVPNALRRSLTSLFAIPVFYIAYREMNYANDYGIKPKKYKTSPLSEEKKAHYLEKIENAMVVEKLYLNQNLTLQNFSKSIGIQSKYISQVINQNLNLSFSEYLLQYRLKEVKKNLLDPKKKNLTLHGIAQNSGFSSNSRFNYVFKKDTGLTPKQFRDQKA